MILGLETEPLQRGQISRLTCLSPLHKSMGSIRPEGKEEVFQLSQELGPLNENFFLFGGRVKERNE